MIFDTIATLRSTLRRGIGLGVGLIALAIVLAGCDTNVGSTPNPETPSITDYATEVAALSALGDALQQAGLADQLDGDGSFTVFAPTNDAFGAIEAQELMLPRNEALLEEVLTYHVVPQDITTENISNGMTVETLEGDELTFRVFEDSIKVNGARITNPDANASNGTVHVVNGVLLETTDAVDRAALAPQFSILRRLIDEAGLAEALRGAGPNATAGLTVFAPTNAAFLAALDADGSGRVEDDEVPDESTLQSILQYHVLDDEFFAADVPTSATDVPTLEGSTVTVQRSSGSVTVNGANVVAADVAVENGVIHGIDTVLMP